MAGVTLRNLTKVFKDVVAVNDLDLEIRDREFLVLVGPSGCGKTTALRMVAGLEEATGGEIYIGDRLVNDVSPKDRDIAMVFQNYALYPHMTVYENMAFGLKLRQLGGFFWQLAHYGEAQKRKREIHRQVTETAEMLGLGNLLARKPKQLSGGQRQRVALGRAIVREPKVFLMDEPLSNLDAKLRVQTRAELSKLHRRLGITTIYVTHDQVEAMTMGDRIAVLNEGVLQQCDTPLTLYNQPANTFVAGFIGSPAMNFLGAALVAKGEDCWFDTGFFQVAAPRERREALQPYAGKQVIFGIRPPDIYGRDQVPPNLDPGAENTVDAVCEVTEPMGDRVHVYLSLFGEGEGNGKPLPGAEERQTSTGTLIADVTAETRLPEGERLELVFDMAKTHAFDAETGAAIY